MASRWSRILCGGAGWTKNSERHSLIHAIKDNLDMWRDFDDPMYLDEAKRLIEEAS